MESFLDDPRNRLLYTPISARPRITWPDGARVAFWVAPNVEYYEYQPPADEVVNIFSRVPVPPDAQQYGLRDYGNRVGLWRLIDLFDEYSIRPTVSLNIAVLEHYPEICEAMVSRGWTFMSHGFYNTRAIGSYTIEQEREFYRDSKETLRRLTGQDLRGMLGPQLSASLRTPDLMAEAGLIYHADWPIDDQPVPVLTTAGRLVSVPYSYDHNDLAPGLGYNLEPWAAQCKAQFDRLWLEGENSGRVMCIALHPLLAGQPHAIGYLRDVLAHVSAYDGVWHTTADDIADHYLRNYYDEHVEHARCYLPEEAS